MVVLQAMVVLLTLLLFGCADDCGAVGVVRCVVIVVGGCCLCLVWR